MTAEPHSDEESQYDEELNFQEEEDSSAPVNTTTESPKRGWGAAKKMAVAVLVIVAVALVVSIPVVLTQNKTQTSISSGTGSGTSTSTSSVSSNSPGVGVDSDSNNNAEPPAVDVSTEDPLGSITTEQEPPKSEQGTQSTPTTTEDSESSTAEESTTGSSSTESSTTPPASGVAGVSTQLACSALNITDGNGTSWMAIAEEIVGETSFDLSGFSIDMSADGSIVAIASIMNGGAGDRAGHVRVYKYTLADGFQQLGQDLDGENAMDWFGSSVSLDSAGFRLAVGGRWSDGANEEDSGHVRVFDYDQGENKWIQVGAVNGKAAGDQMGRSVSLSADGLRLAVGASNADATARNLTDMGEVYVFDYVDGEWDPIGTIQGDESLDVAGSALSLSKDGLRVAVGAYSHDSANGQPDVGQVKVFQYDSEKIIWSQVGQDIDGTSPGEWAGAVVSLSYDGNRVAVAVPGDSNNFMPGLTRVYEIQDGTWVQLGNDLKGGYSVSLSSDASRVAVGDYKGFSAGINSGMTNIFEYNKVSSSWDIVGQEINGEPLEMSGTAVALSADGLRVAISAPAHTSADEKQQVGATRVFDLCGAYVGSN